MIVSVLMTKKYIAPLLSGLCILCAALLACTPLAPPEAPETTVSTAAPTTVPTTIPATVPATIPTTLPATTASTSPTHPLRSPYCFVYDSLSGEVLLDHGGVDTPVYPASITKLFSVYVALKYLPLDQVVTVGQEITLIDPESSLAWLRVGYQLTVEQLVQGMIMCSGNDAAYALAAAVGYRLADSQTLTPRQAVDRFVAEMNVQAQALGLTGTHFVTPDGIHDDDHYTTARDLFTISQLAMDMEPIRRFAATKKATVTLVSGQQLQWYNTNALLYEEFRYYLPDALGLKTGTEDLAGHCLVSVFPKGEGYVYILVLGGETSADRFEDTLYLHQTYVKE